jgi:protein phosphatase
MEDFLEVRPVTTADGRQLLVAMVADGIGGESSGEVASRLAVQTTFQTLEKAELRNGERIPDILEAALENANAAVLQTAKENKDKEGMGTTATVAVIYEGKLYLANVGDSRAYLVQKGQATQLTRDHTWAYEMMRLQRISQDEAKKHPKREELARSLGEKEVTVDLGLFLEEKDTEESAQRNQGLLLKPGQWLLLCSDGLIKERNGSEGHFVETPEIIRTLTHYSPQVAADRLVQKAAGRRADAGLPKKVDTIIGFEHGTNVSPEGKSEGFTHVFVVTFKDEAGRETYLKHPAHDAYVQIVKDKREKVVVFDYWAGK